MQTTLPSFCLHELTPPKAPPGGPEFAPPSSPKYRLVTLKEMEHSFLLSPVAAMVRLVKGLFELAIACIIWVASPQEFVNFLAKSWTDLSRGSVGLIYPISVPIFQRWDR